MKKLLPIKRSHIATILLLPFAITGLFYVISARNTYAEGYSNLLVDTGVPDGDPIFTVVNFLPGDCEVRSISVENTGNIAQDMTVRSNNVVDEDSLSNILDFAIEENSNLLYQDSLSEFFAESAGLDGIVLNSLGPNETKIYKFTVCFNVSAGNEYQNTEVVFDLLFGNKISPIELPEECQHLTGIITSVITGTPGNNRINGTSASELILGNGGKDRIDGGSGHDCIVTLDGDDRIDGGSGNDVIIAGNGTNRIEGGSGDDKIYAGNDNDRISGDSGNDLIYSFGGDDRIYGDSGDDIIYAGSGDDDIRGNSGHDTIYGEEGDDKINADTGNDYLDGGANTDNLRGGTGTDECINGESLSSCEI